MHHSNLPPSHPSRRTHTSQRSSNRKAGRHRLDKGRTRTSVLNPPCYIFLFFFFSFFARDSGAASNNDGVLCLVASLHGSDLNRRWRISDRTHICAAAVCTSCAIRLPPFVCRSPCYVCAQTSHTHNMDQPRVLATPFPGSARHDRIAIASAIASHAHARLPKLSRCNSACSSARALPRDRCRRPGLRAGGTSSRRRYRGPSSSRKANPRH